MTTPSCFRISRRRFCGVTGSAVVGLALGAACAADEQGSSGGRIAARPRRDATTSGGGYRALGLDSSRDAVLQLPGRATGAPLPLLVLLHGAGGSGAGILRRLGGFASDAGIAVLAPDARGSTWDAVRGDFGRDVTFLERALQRVFETTAVDPERVSVGGFSDGASYAISLGLVNGDLFRRVLAFSPGFFVSAVPQGRPRFFLSHGTADPVLPIDRCSRRIVPMLQKAGYEVTFRQFDGGHEIPPNIALAGMRWAAARG